MEDTSGDVVLKIELYCISKCVDRSSRQYQNK